MTNDSIGLYDVSTVILVLAAALASCDGSKDATSKETFREASGTKIADRSSTASVEAGAVTGSAENIIAKQLARLEERSSKILNRKPCSSEEIARCSELERNEEWAQAGICYLEAPVWFDLGASVDCAPHHKIKAAANFDRAGLKQQATSRRMEVYRGILGNSDDDHMALVVDRANFLASRGDVDRARELYAVYLVYAADSASAPATIVQHVENQCRATGGPCDLMKEVSAEEVKEVLEP